jgi:hypothetical protein
LTVLARSGTGPLPSGSWRGQNGIAGLKMPAGIAVEAMWVAALLAIHLLINLATAGWYPSVWVDEIQFADPAINLVSGHGWTSTVWIAQGTQDFWAGNAPLYSCLLASWLDLLGSTDRLAVRALNPILLIGVVLAVWSAARRSQWLPGAGWRLALVALLLTGHSVFFGMRWGRYDVVAMFVAAAALRLWVGRFSALRAMLLFLLGALFPFAGLQLLPAAAVVMAAALIACRPRPWARTAALGSGLVAGVGLLWGWLALHGVVDGFLASTRAVGVVGRSPWNKLLDMPHVLMADKSLLLLLAAAGLALALGAGRRSPTGLYTSASASPWPPLALALALPLVLNLLAKFPVYYGWMTYLPLAVALHRAMVRLDPMLPWRRVAVMGIAGFSLLPGLPLRLVAADVVDLPAEAAAVGLLIDRNLGPGDQVLTDFKAYYAVRHTGATAYGVTALQVLTPTERAAIGWMVTRPGDEARLQDALGGRWRQTDSWQPGPTPAWPRRVVRELDEQIHGLEVWQRVPDAPTLTSFAAPHGGLFCGPAEPDPRKTLACGILAVLGAPWTVKPLA